jgi:ornithine decarboxylase
MAPSAVDFDDNGYLAVPNQINQNLSYYEKSTGVTQDNELKSTIIGGALRARVEAVDGDTCEAGEEDAFFVADLGDVYRQHLRWKMNLARVKPHFGKQTSSIRTPRRATGANSTLL